MFEWRNPVSKSKNIKFGIGEFENDRSRNSVIDFRSRFLQTADRLCPTMSNVIISDLLELYRTIPLFCYEAELGRKTRFREPWYRVNRPPWSIIEDAWSHRCRERLLKIRFDPYYAVMIGEMDWEHPAGRLAVHDDPKIDLFVGKIFEW